MPDVADPFASVGYLVAAATMTVVGLLAYGLSVARRLGAERQRARQLMEEQGAARIH
jgi:hypothetical protein